MSASLRAAIGQGAVEGLAVWLVYGIVEYFFIAFVHGVYTRHFVFQHWHWWMNLLVLALFAAIGAAAGACAGFVSAAVLPRLRRLRGIDPAALRGALPLMFLIAAYLGSNLYLIRGYGLLTFSVPLCLTLLVSQVASCFRRIGRLDFLTNPWTTSSLLVGVLWMLKSFFPTEPSLFRKAAWAMIFAGAVLLVTWGMRKAVARLAPSPAVTAGGTLSRLALAAAAAFAVSLFGHQPIVQGRPRMDTAPPRGNPPNIVWIVMDTVRADHLSVYGYHRKTTANLEKLRGEATFFANAVSPSDFTLSSHGSMFTGLYPSRHGAHFTQESPHGRPLAAQHRTLAEILSEKGYFTIAVAANQAYLAADFGMNQGFGVYRAWASLPLLGPLFPYCLRTSTRPLLQHVLPTTELQTFLRDAEGINETAFEFLHGASGKQGRFFLFLNYMDAHFPRNPPKSITALYPGIDETFSWNDFFALEAGVLRLRRTLTERERMHLTSQYDAAIHYLDLQLGRLFAELKRLDLYDDCLLIVTSDHGEAFGEKNLFEHGVSVYQNQVHVPLIVKYPRARGSTVVADFVGVADLMPTILDLLGYEAPPGLDGRSLLRPDQQRGRAIISESHSFGRYRNMHPRFRRVERAVFLGPKKLITSTSGKQEFYDVAEDPEESRNLLTSGNGEAREQKEMLDAWVSLISPAKKTAPAKQSRETIERLRSLGYIQ